MIRLAGWRVSPGNSRATYSANASGAWPGCPVDDGEPALRLADAGLAIDAAANGLGQANVPAMLAEADIASGRVHVVREAFPVRRGYWLVAPTPQWRQAKVKALVAALTA